MSLEGGATGAVRNNGSGARGGGGGGQAVLKKGPWTTAEDTVLMEYVKRHGEGNWNAVQRNSGLMRCGKSCRLRWANHLRPNLKKGAFTPDEERQIIELHSKLGNKWARMALHLHGRTDNEIKNYWNTRLKRRQRAGLPIYPIEIQQHKPNSASPLHQNPQFYRSSPNIFNSFNFTSPNAPYPSDNSHIKLLRNNTSNACVALSLLSPNQPFSTSSTMSPVPPYFSNVLPTLDFSMNALPNTMGTSFIGVGFSQAELPSIQPPPLETIAQTSSTNTESDYVIPTSSEANNYEIVPELYSRGNSGLLGDVLGESQALMRSEKENRQGKHNQDWELVEDPNAIHVESIFKVGDSNTTAENHLEDSSSGDHSSLEIGMNTKEINEFEEMNFLMEDDLSSLLDFPISEPLSDCYGANDGVSVGNYKSSESATDGNVRTTMDDHREVSCSPVLPAPVGEENHERNQGACCWNNMPGFC